MTQEQKAIAYDKALERAKESLKDGGISQNSIDYIQSIFPELRESEDEKIRKEIIYHIQNCDDTIDEETEKRMLAWLEKLGELKSCWKPTEEQFEALDYAYNSCPDTERGNYYEGVLGNLIDDLYRLEKQGQKPIAIDIDKMVDDYANNNERGNEEFGKPINCMIRAYRQGLNDAYYKTNCKGYQETGRCFADGECEAKKKAESCWNEKDKKMLRCIGNAITADDASTYLESKDIQVIDAHVWLDELKDRVQPQPKQEWDEDDEEIFSEIILRCEKYGNQEQIDWLKSLKERYTWKPSNKQMGIIAQSMAVLKVSGYDELGDRLGDISEQLNKLRGE